MDRPNDRMTQTIWIVGVVPIMDEFLPFQIDFIDAPTVCAKPQYARTIFIDVVDLIIAQACGIIGIVYVPVEFPPLLIEYIEPSAIRTNPENTRFIFVKRIDRIMTQL